MKTHYSISIPKPCHENWNNMIPEDKGKFCQSCSKSVIDFSQKPQQTIEDYLANNSDKKICGRFKASQLATIQIKIPKQIIEQHMSFHRLFLLALLITMGTSLLNCSDQNGNTKKIDAVEAVDTLKTKSIIIPETTISKVDLDSIPTKVVPKKPDPIKNNLPPVPHLTGLIIIEDTKTEPVHVDDIELDDVELEDDVVFGYLSVDRTPELQNTPKDLSESEKKKYMTRIINEIITKNFNTNLGKELNLEGKQKILAQFVINKNGFVTNIQTRATHSELEEEAKRVIKLLPQFIPGQQQGRDVGVVCSLPIVFMVED